MAFAPFVPLRVFSSYTMLDGAIDPKAIAKTAEKRGFPAIAITDRNGLYGSAAFAKACKDAGVQPVVGTMLAVARPQREGASAPGFGPQAPTIDWLAIYAQDERGYDNICHLVSRAHLDRPLEYAPHVLLGDLEGHTDGLICLTAAGEGRSCACSRANSRARRKATSTRFRRCSPTGSTSNWHAGAKRPRKPPKTP
jgi:DNA polymerase-3 subunit alpha